MYSPCTSFLDTAPTQFCLWFCRDPAQTLTIIIKFLMCPCWEKDKPGKQNVSNTRVWERLLFASPFNEIRSSQVFTVQKLLEKMLCIFYFWNGRKTIQCLWFIVSNISVGYIYTLWITVSYLAHILQVWKLVPCKRVYIQSVVAHTVSTTTLML